MHDKVVGMRAALHPVSPLIEPKCGWSLGWGFVKLKYRAVRNFTQQKTHLCQWVNKNKDLQDNQ
ncbi:hypothetical protein HUZ94_00865 [Cronobacter sakazakii]|uniref:hypothetical protein n=1 Tax=Cronobacter sakazakii TaxID=28141 RepID=UPI0015880D88|nr:hypothetical protein [Cronobacter sakazakii]NUW62141.1 hypothetical protein [Cronobacter sakazakii]